GSFLFGAGIAAVAMPRLAAWTMLPPVALLLFVIGQDLVRPIVEIETRGGRDAQGASRRDPDRSVDH
ncbi:MAG: hypothetical protein ACO4CI_12925, partial [Phycisphaerales bacterium]